MEKNLAFTPVSHSYIKIIEYPRTFCDLNRGGLLGLNYGEICRINESLSSGDHVGPSCPTSVNLILSNDTRENLEQIFKCLEYALADIGLKLVVDVDLSQIKLSSMEPGVFKRVVPIFITINSYYGVSVFDVLSSQKNRMPVYSPLWLLVLNPTLASRLICTDLRGMVIPGLSLSDDRTVLIIRSGGTLHVAPFRKSTVIKEEGIVIPTYPNYS